MSEIKHHPGTIHHQRTSVQQFLPWLSKGQDCKACTVTPEYSVIWTLAFSCPGTPGWLWISTFSYRRKAGVCLPNLCPRSGSLLFFFWCRPLKTNISISIGAWGWKGAPAGVNSIIFTTGGEGGHFIFSSTICHLGGGEEARRCHIKLVPNMNKEEGIYFCFLDEHLIFIEDIAAFTLTWENKRQMENKENAWFWGTRMSNFTEDVSCTIDNSSVSLGSNCPLQIQVHVFKCMQDISTSFPFGQDMMLSETKQTQKDKQLMVSLIYGSWSWSQRSRK